jgi:hypothetical protein
VLGLLQKKKVEHLLGPFFGGGGSRNTMKS